MTLEAESEDQARVEAFEMNLLVARPEAYEAMKRTQAGIHEVEFEDEFDAIEWSVPGSPQEAALLASDFAEIERQGRENLRASGILTDEDLGLMGD